MESELFIFKQNSEKKCIFHYKHITEKEPVKRNIYSMLSVLGLSTEEDLDLFSENKKDLNLPPSPGELLLLKLENQEKEKLEREREELVYGIVKTLQRMVYALTKTKFVSYKAKTHFLNALETETGILYVLITPPTQNNQKILLKKISLKYVSLIVLTPLFHVFIKEGRIRSKSFEDEIEEILKQKIV